MTKSEYDFVLSEIEREKTASPFYLACRELPDNYEELRREYENMSPLNRLILMPYISVDVYPKYIKL